MALSYTVSDLTPIVYDGQPVTTCAHDGIHAA
jgi:hypothetical protein